MKPRERMLTALEVKQPDRVPVWVHAMNEASIINIGRHFTDNVPDLKHAAEMTFEEMARLLEVLFIIHEQLDIDAITCLPNFQEEDLGDDLVKDQWGVVLKRNPYGLSYPVEGPIKEPSDLKTYSPPKPNPDDTLLMLQIAKGRFGGERALAFFGGGPFLVCCDLRGMDNYLMDFVLNPQFAHDLARMVADHNLEVIDMALDAGAEMIVVEDDLAFNQNTMMSPAQFDEFIGPYLKEYVNLVHSKNKKVVHHSDGNIWPILDSLVDLGYDGINPLQPQGGMHLKKVKEHCGDRVCLLGNIDCAHLLPFGSTSEVEEAVQQAIEDAAPGGGYVICSSNTIHPGVKPENFLAMVEAARKYGVYGT